MSDIFDDLFGEFMGGRRGGGPALRPRARRRPALQHGDHARRRPSRGKTAQIRVPTSVTCDACTGTGAKAGHQALDLPDLRRHRQGAREPGLLHHRAHLSRLPGPRRDHQRSVRRLQRLGPRGQGAHAFGQHSGRASRTARASGSPAKAKLACAAARPAISTSSCRSSRTSSSSATAPTSSAACRSP